MLFDHGLDSDDAPVTRGRGRPGSPEHAMRYDDGVVLVEFGEGGPDDVESVLAGALRMADVGTAGAVGPDGRRAGSPRRSRPRAVTAANSPLCGGSTSTSPTCGEPTPGCANGPLDELLRLTVPIAELRGDLDTRERQARRALDVAVAVGEPTPG